MGNSQATRNRRVRASCALGQHIGNSPTESVSTCVPGGRECWHRLVPTRLARPAETHPLAIHEAFDFLDMVWHERFGSTLLGVTPLAEVARLTAQPTSRNEVVAHLVALKIIFDSLRPDRDLVPQPDSQVPKPKGSLDSVEAIIVGSLSNPIAAVEAIGALRTASRIRNNYQHPDRRDLLRDLTALGIEDTLDRPIELWAGVSSSVISALITLRNEVRADRLASPEFEAEAIGAVEPPRQQEQL